MKKQLSSEVKSGVVRCSIVPFFYPSRLQPLLALAACQGGSSTATDASSPPPVIITQTVRDAVATATPIKHLVVIFGEDLSFDHYFATYPAAANQAGEPQLTPAAGTPIVDNLASNNLIAANPNALPTSPNTAGRMFGAINIAGLQLPATDLLLFRLARTQASTRSQIHSDTAEQLAYNDGAMDSFPLFTGVTSSIPGSTGAFGTKGQVLGYFDGNTLTALRNYTQHFAMNQTPIRILMLHRRRAHLKLSPARTTA